MDEALNVHGPAPVENDVRSDAAEARVGGRVDEVDDRAGRPGPTRPAVAGFDDEDAVHAAYLLHGAEIYRFLLRGLGDAGAAQDVTQETFLKAWRAGDRYDPTLSSLRVWLFGIARNAMIDHTRASQARPWQHRLIDPPTAQECARTVADPSEEMVGHWLVEEALRRVSEHHRVAIVRTHLEERPYDEVAAELGIPVGTLRSRVFYGLKALRSAMDEMGVVP